MAEVQASQPMHWAWSAPRKPGPPQEQGCVGGKYSPQQGEGPPSGLQAASVAQPLEGLVWESRDGCLPHGPQPRAHGASPENC